MKDRYESLYKASKAHFGTTPSPVALLLVQHCRGRILDIGCGQGRDALHLASKGLQVTAIDISPTAVNDLLKEARQAGLAIDAQERDMDDLPAGPFDAIFSDFSLQMVAPNDRKEYIGRLKAAYPDAIHAHAVPISSVCFGQEFVFDDTSLKEAYADWETLFYEEAWAIAPAPNKDNEPYLVREARIICRRG